MNDIATHADALRVRLVGLRHALRACRAQAELMEGVARLLDDGPGSYQVQEARASVVDAIDWLCQASQVITGKLYPAKPEPQPEAEHA